MRKIKRIFKRKKMENKIKNGYLVFLIILDIVAVSIVFILFRLNTGLIEYEERELIFEKVVSDSKSEINNIMFCIQSIVISQTVDNNDEKLQEIKIYQNKIQVNLDLLKSNYPEEQLKIDEYESLIKEFNKETESLTQTLLKQGNSAVKEEVFENYMLMIQDIYGYCDQLNVKVNLIQEASLVQAKELIKSAEVIIIVSLIAGHIFYGLLGIHMKKKITQPLEELKTITKELSEGKLNMEFQSDDEDEISQVKENLSFCVKKWNGYIGDITRSMRQMEYGYSKIYMLSQFEGDYKEIEYSIQRMGSKCMENTCLRKT